MSKKETSEFLSRSELIEDLVKSWNHSYSRISDMPFESDKDKLRFLKLNFDGILERLIANLKAENL